MKQMNDTMMKALEKNYQTHMTKLNDQVTMCADLNSKQIRELQEEAQYAKNEVRKQSDKENSLSMQMLEQELTIREYALRIQEVNKFNKELEDKIKGINAGIEEKITKAIEETRHFYENQIETEKNRHQDELKELQSKPKLDPVVCSIDLDPIKTSKITNKAYEKIKQERAHLREDLEACNHEREDALLKVDQIED